MDPEQAQEQPVRAVGHNSWDTKVGPESGAVGRVDPGALGHRESVALRPGRDVGEDASRVRKGSSPEVLAALRNVANYLLGE